ncbi:MAG: tetratricopeptide repeat protein [Methylobacteriaceae bacterium]|nr:tetratricopeptide repeat protein [Methylobacteriaceae bacterium]
MSDIFREVDEDVRRDQAAQIWARYQNLFIGLAVLVIAATAGWRIYDHFRTKQAEEAGAKYEAALTLARDGKAAEAEGALEQITKTGPKGYATLARLREAAEYSGSDSAAAVKAYDAIAADSAIDPLFQNVARLRAALLRLDEADAKEVETRLVPMTANDNPFRFSAREALALAALKQDDFDAAGRQLDAIVVDPQAPSSMRQRAEALLAVVRSSKRAK